MRGIGVIGIAAFCLLALDARAETCEEFTLEGARAELQQVLADLKRANDTYTAEWFEAANKPDGTRTDEPAPSEVLAKLRKQLDGIGCMAKLIVEVRAAVDGVSKAKERLRQKEAKCRASSTCMARRRAIVHAPEVCELLDQRTAIVGSIKEERANPAGVVSLAQLHELGEALQATDYQLAQSKSDFFQQTKVRFDGKMCKELKVDAEGNYITPVILDPS